MSSTQHMPELLDYLVKKEAEVRHAAAIKQEFQCASCDKSFKQKCALKEHSRMHTGERPFQCEVCEMSFADSSNLKKHSRIVEPMIKPCVKVEYVHEEVKIEP